MSTTTDKPAGQTRGSGAVRRELLLAGPALLTGLLLAPVAVWFVGRATLGEYTHGGASAFLADYLRGLGRGETAYWIMLLGPYGFLLLGRLALRFAR